MNIFVIDLASTKNITAHINDLEILNSHVIVACDPPIAYRLAKEVRFLHFLFENLLLIFKSYIFYTDFKAIFGHFAKVRSWIFVHTWKISGFWDFLEINPNIRLQINIISMSIPQVSLIYRMHTNNVPICL